MSRCLRFLPFLIGCSTGPLDLPNACEAGAPVSHLAMGDGDYRHVEDGADIECGIPPQGGAPYTPFQIRIAGLDQNKEGLTVSMESIDMETGELLGTSNYVQYFICSYAGENKGFYVTSEFHMRYPDRSLDDLDGREAEVVIEATNSDGESVIGSFIGWMNSP